MLHSISSRGLDMDSVEYGGFAWIRIQVIYEGNNKKKLWLRTIKKCKMKQFLIENHHKIDETFHDRVVCIQDPDRFFLFGSGCGLEKNHGDPDPLFSWEVGSRSSQYQTGSKSLSFIDWFTKPLKQTLQSYRLLAV